MEIKVRTSDLYGLSDYLIEVSNQLAEDSSYISSLSESLSQVLHGVGQQTISTRMTNFNNTQFSRLSSYAKSLSSQLEICAKLYDSEESDFAEKMKREASKYGGSSVGFSGTSNTRFSSNNTFSSSVMSNENRNRVTSTDNTNDAIINNTSTAVTPSTEAIKGNFGAENSIELNNTNSETANNFNSELNYNNYSDKQQISSGNNYSDYSFKNTFSQSNPNLNVNLDSNFNTMSSASSMSDSHLESAIPTNDANITNEQFNTNSYNMSGILAGGVLAAGGIGVASHKKNKDEGEK